MIRTLKRLMSPVHKWVNIFLGAYLIFQASDVYAQQKLVKLYLNPGVSANTTGHLLKLFIDEAQFASVADSIYLFLPDMKGAGVKYIQYLGIKLPGNSGVFEGDSSFTKEIDYQFHKVLLTVGDSVIYSSPLKLSNPKVVSKIWKTSPEIIQADSFALEKTDYISRLDYFMPAKEGIWQKTDNNLLRLFDYKGALLFEFNPSNDLNWVELYDKVLKGKRNKVIASNYRDWFTEHNRFHIPLYHMYLSQDNHLYVHAAVQPFSLESIGKKKKALVAVPYALVIKINRQTHEVSILHCSKKIDNSERPFYDFDNFMIHGDHGFVATDIEDERRPFTGISRFKVKGNKIFAPKAVKLPAHPNADFILTTANTVSFIPMGEQLFAIRSRDNRIFDINLKKAIALDGVNSESFNLIKAGRFDSERWFILSSNENGQYSLRIMNKTDVIQSFPLDLSNNMLSKLFIYENTIYIPEINELGQSFLKRYTLKF